MKRKSLITIGMCIWLPIWILSYMPNADKFLESLPHYNIIGAFLVVTMIVGIAMMMIGILKDN